MHIGNLAHETLRAIRERDPVTQYDGTFLVSHIEAAIAKAVAAEREACAKLVDSRVECWRQPQSDGPYPAACIADVCENAAHAIRDRGNK
jgi:hypothetical protein